MLHLLQQFLCALFGSVAGVLVVWRFLVMPAVLKAVAREMAKVEADLALLEHKLAIYTGSPLGRSAGPAADD